MTDTIDVAALVERRELTVEQKEACGYLAHQVLGGDGFTSDHARTLLALLADFERHHKSARTALQSQADALAEARRENERLNDMNVEISINAHQWMVAHDMRAAGEPYFFPKPADTPELLARATTAEASLATMREALEEIAHSAETHSHVIVIARAALAKEGK